MKITAEVKPISAVTSDESAQFIDWAWQQREGINLDKDTLSYPRACMTIAKDESGPVAYIPLQPVLMFESLVKRPDLTARKTAYSLWKIGQIVESIMSDTGHREAYFLTTSQPEADSCEKHGWIKSLYDPEKKTWLMKRKIEAAKQ